MERYLHYFDRYNNHARSLKLEAELEAKVPEKVESLQVRWPKIGESERARGGGGGGGGGLSRTPL